MTAAADLPWLRSGRRIEADPMKIRGVDIGAPLATQEAIDARLPECRRRGARHGGHVRTREAALAEVRAFLSGVFGR